MEDPSTANGAAGPALAARCYEFVAGLPAFEEQTRFRLVEKPEYAPLVVLESAQAPELRFVCAPAELLVPGFQYDVSEEERAVLGEGDRICLAVLTFSDDAPPTANLMAPILLCPATGRGVQAIQAEPRYSHCQPIRRASSC